ncbi:hypothetical protein BC567DRAFT_207696 [Phyllosticta citribraziliensis]
MAGGPANGGRTADGSSPALSPLHVQQSQGPVASTQSTNSVSPPLPLFTSFPDGDVSREEQDISAFLAQFDSSAPFDTVDPSALSSPTPMLHAPDSCFVSRSCNASPFDTLTPASNAATIGNPMDADNAWPPADNKEQNWTAPAATQWWATSTPRTPGQEEGVPFDPATEPIRRSNRLETNGNVPRVQPPRFHHPKPFPANGGLAVSPQQGMRAHSMPPQGPSLSPGQNQYHQEHVQQQRSIEKRPQSFHPQQQRPQRHYRHAPSHSVPHTPQPPPSFPLSAAPSPTPSSPQIIFTRAVQPRNMRVNPPVPIAVAALPSRKQTPSSPPRHPYPAALTVGSRPLPGAMMQQQGPAAMSGVMPPNRALRPATPGTVEEASYQGAQSRQRRYGPGPYHPYSAARGMAITTPRSMPTSMAWSGASDGGLRIGTDDVRMRIGSITELPAAPDVMMGGMGGGASNYSAPEAEPQQNRSTSIESAPLEPPVQFRQQRDSLSLAAALATEMDMFPRLSLSGLSLPGSLGKIDELDDVPSSSGDQDGGSGGGLNNDAGPALSTSSGAAAVPNSLPAPPPSAASTAQHSSNEPPRAELNGEPNPGSEADDAHRRRCSSLSELEQWKFRMMNDQTTLSLGTLSHIERLQVELEDLKRFATSGFAQVKDGMDRDLESKRLELRNMNAGTTELTEPLNALPTSMRKDSFGKYEVPPLAPLNGDEIRQMDNDAVVALLGAYKLPFDREMFLFQKKEVYLKFIGACRELMHKVLD